jgi:hypothetical protein
MNHMDVTGTAIHVRMYDVKLIARETLGLTCKMPHTQPAWPFSIHRHPNLFHRQIMLKVMRDHGDIMALGQHLKQINAVSLGTTKAAAKAVNQKCDP